eukprot:TRINITY_DN7878_c0_g2_i1.p1 TRINITY_DN7878_c0_g2~~TRINITY_DN7878_c0_g2_i1.p1  ORF type:complete len:512 (+),score=96.65 TRINITY_DN7878_c0_g2_i1:97-1536(+)
MQFEEGTYEDWKQYILVFRSNADDQKREIRSRVTRFVLTMGLFHKAGRGWIDRIEMFQFSDWMCGDILFHHYLSSSLRTNDLLLSDSDHHHNHHNQDARVTSNEYDTVAITLPPFVMIWTRPVEEFRVRHLAAIESLFYHHPAAVVHVVSNTLPYDFFRSFWTSGYNVKIHRFDFEHLEYHLPHVNAIKFVRKMREHTINPSTTATTTTTTTGYKRSDRHNTIRQELYHFHLTDFLRLAYLYMWGGVSTDFDIILMKPLSPWIHHNFAFADPCEHSSLFWCLSSSALSDTRSKGEGYSVSSGMMSFERGHPFIARALALYDTEYQLEWEMIGIDPECVHHYHHIDLTTKVLSIAWKDTKNNVYELEDNYDETDTDREEDGNDEVQIDMKLLRVFEEDTDESGEGSRTRHVSHIDWKEMLELMEADIPERRWRDIRSKQFYFRLHEKITGNLPALPNSLSSRVLHTFRISRRDPSYLSST